MQKYSEWAPTQFDPNGLGLEDRQDWFVCPVIQTRDSEALERANYASMLQILEPYPDDYEEHRFGHWGPGWFEIILVRAGTKAEMEALECEAALASYPVLDDSLFSQMEWDEATETWETQSLRYRMEMCSRAGISIFAARRDYLPEDPQGKLFELLTGN